MADTQRSCRMSHPTETPRWPPDRSLCSLPGCISAPWDPTGAPPTHPLPAFASGSPLVPSQAVTMKCVLSHMTAPLNYVLIPILISVQWLHPFERTSERNTCERKTKLPSLSRGKKSHRLERSPIHIMLRCPSSKKTDGSWSSHHGSVGKTPV